MKKKEKIIGYLSIMYFIVILFYGIIIKITIGNMLLFNFKTILPEIIIIIISMMMGLDILKSKKVNKVSLITIGYISMIFIGNIDKDNVGILYFIRDWLIPIGTIAIALNFRGKFNEQIMDKINLVFIVFIICGFILGIIQKINGWEWTSEFYTGYKFYGLDELSKIKIWTTNGILRIPSLTGNSVSFAFYNLIGFVLVDKIEKLRFKKIVVIMSIVNIIISTNKTALIIVIALYIYRNSNKLKKIEACLLYIFSSIVGGIVVLVIFEYKSSMLFSLGERIRYWKEIILNQNFGGDIFQNTLSVYDNFYISSFFCIGVMGILLIFIMMRMVINKNNKRNKLIANELGIIFCIASITTNIVQGRVYFMAFIILIIILAAME